MSPQPDPTGPTPPLISGTTLSTFVVLELTTRSARWPGLSLPSTTLVTLWDMKWLSNIDAKQAIRLIYA